MGSKVADAEWAREAAQIILQEFSGRCAVDTADYQVCSFILEVAKAVIQDQSLAARIGSVMETRRLCDSAILDTHVPSA